MLRHDEVGQEVLLNLLLRNYLHYNLYEQVRPQRCARMCLRLFLTKGSYIHRLSLLAEASDSTNVCLEAAPAWGAFNTASQMQGTRGTIDVCAPLLQAEALRSKAQRPETARQQQQLARYLYYLGRIQTIQLDYTEAKDSLQQAARKVGVDAHGRMLNNSHVSLDSGGITVLHDSRQCVASSAEHTELGRSQAPLFRGDHTPHGQ